MRVSSRLRLTFTGIFTFILFGVFTTTVQAATFNVSRTDDPAPDGCISGVDCSLREAVMDANANVGPDVIVLQAASTYILSIPGTGGAEEGDLEVTESLTVQGGDKVTTVIDTAAGFNDRIFEVDTGAVTPIDFTVSNLTMQHGNSDGGGGAVSIQGFDTQGIFTNVIVQNNQAAGNGGGIFFSSGGARQFSLQGSNILNNSSASGGGGGVLCSGAGISCDVADSLFSGNESAGGSGGGMLIGTGGDGSLHHTIMNTVFENNTAGGPFGGSGGGLQFGSSKGLQLTGSQFTGNIANGNQGNGGQGGGAFVSSGGQAVGVENCVFQDNQNDGHGGGLYVSVGGTVSVTGSTFDNNESRVGGSGRGGGLYVNNGNQVTVSQSVFSDNTADAEGGGAYFETFNAGGPAVTNSTFSGNTAALAGGGAYFTGNNTGPTITNDTFSGNASAASGGGAYFIGAFPPAIAQSIFSANTAGGDGGGAFFTSGTGPSITNSTFSGNTAEFSGGGMRLSVGGLSSLNNLTVVQNTATTGTGGGAEVGFMTVFRNSLFFQNSAAMGNTDDCAGPSSGLVDSDGYNIWGPMADTADCPVVSEGVNPTDQFGVDPLIGALADNGGPTLTHALLSGSPAIDAGNPAGCKGTDGNDITVDQRGKVRPSGSACDIGAFEVSDEEQICQGNPGIDADLGSALGAPVVTGTTVGGGDDFNTGCGASDKEDRGYIWTAPQDGTYTFSLTDPNSAVIALTFANTDCQGDFDCHFPNSPFGTRIVRTFPAGTKVVIKVDDSRNDGSFGLNILLSEAGQCSDGIDNDGDDLIDAADMFDCVCNGDATGIDGNLGSALGTPVVTGTTVGGGDDFLTNCGAEDKEDRAYVWTSPTDDTYEFYLSDPNGAVLAMTFSDGSCTGNFECHFPNSPFGDRITRFFPAGTSILLIIDDSRNDGSFELNITVVGDCVPEDCDDDNACNGVETCQNNQCMPGTPVVCSDDGNQCNGASPVCDPVTGQCADSIPPVTCSDDGNQCNGASPVCDPGTGQCADSVPPVTCSDDGNQCNGASPVCNPGTGQCADSVPPVVCGDGNVCNGTETCNPGTGACDAGTPLNCQDGNACNGVEICNPTLGCQSGTPIDCDDHDPCTADSCDSVSGCVNTPLPDSDGDGTCDAEDDCPGDAENDADNDGVCGDEDNCPDVANPGQEDEDDDGIGDACDEPQDNCDCCANTSITAKLFYKPLKWIIGDFCGCRKIKIPLPSHLQVVEGNAGNQWASVAFIQNHRPVGCFYKGGANSSHPTSPSQIAKGLKYNFSYCTNGMRPGQTMNTDKIALVVLSGDSQSPNRHNPRTVVTMPIVENSSTGCDVCSQPGGEGSCH
jgi:hypothetical protein